MASHKTSRTSLFGKYTKNVPPGKVVRETLHIQIDNEGEAWKTMDIVGPLDKGGIGVLPTESGYGIVTRLDSRVGIERLLRLKNEHEHKKPLSLLCSTLSTIDQYCTLYALPKQTFKILKKNLPGSYTFILKAQSSLPKGIVFDHKGSKHTWKRDTLGVRMPADPVLRYFQDELYEGIPLLVSSLPTDDDDDDVSNMYKMVPLRPDDMWWKAVDFVVDAGPRPQDGSTVIDLTSRDGEPQLLREGLGSLELST